MSERPSASAIEEQIRDDRPHLAGDLEYDRAWLWYCGRPSDQDREYLKELKFRYRNKDHPLPSGRTGRWFYWHAIPPIHKGKSNGNGKQAKAPAPPQQPARVDLSALVKPKAEPQQQPLTPEAIEALVRAELGL